MYTYPQGNKGMGETKEYILPDDVCYTCGEAEDGCECSEEFDSTLARERDNNFDENYWPRSVADIRQDTANQMGFDTYKDMLASIGITVKE